VVAAVTRKDSAAMSPAALPRLPRPGRYNLAAAGLMVASLLLNVAYLVCDCPLDLAPDEAHYWHWSRHLDWSYYSKGPLVAWLIRGSCELFGGLSVRLVGSEMLAVRLPAVVCHVALLAGWYVLTVGVFRNPKFALAVVALALTLPGVSAAAVLMTIDPPFLVCWCWALVFAWKAVSADRLGWWLLAGVCSAVGVLAKYPMLLFPVAITAFLIADPDRRHLFRRPGFWLMVALTAVGLTPVLLWNAAHDWVSVRHVLGQAGIGGGPRPHRFEPLVPLAFAAGQAGLLLGFWFVALAAAAWRFRPRATSENGLSFLWWTSVPVWAVFFAASGRTTGQVNWPAAAYVSGLVLAVAWVRERLDPHNLRRKLIVAGLVGAIWLGLVLSVGAHFPGLARPILAAVAGPASPDDPAPIRKLDPTCRLRGWRTLAAELDRLRERVNRETGAEPVLAGMVWTTPGELAFYCRGHPEAYSFGLALADRHSQYDLWRPNPVADAQAFRGRSFLYIGDEIPEAAEVFDRVEPPVRVVHQENGVPVAVWKVWIGHGFRGFPRPRSGRPGY
jgi:4-amino-4-deoxy-L-arabinose transferase-like glycosyltransferase